MKLPTYSERKSSLISEYSLRNNVSPDRVLYGECLILEDYWKVVTTVDGKAGLVSTIRDWYKIKEELEKNEKDE